jgi:hypothetical protein
MQAWLLIVNMILLEVPNHHVNSILYALPGSIFSVGHRTRNNRPQGDSRIVALEAR